MFDEHLENIKLFFNDRKKLQVFCFTGFILAMLLWGLLNENIMKAFTHPVNVAVFFVIFLVFIGGLNRLRQGKNSGVVPSLLTTIGVFGTFLGIFLGLLEFDVSNETKINESIKDLLDGLKIAFLSSIEGMGAALLFRGFILLKKGKSTTDTLAENIAQANSDSITNALEKFIKDFNEGLTAQFGENFKQLNESVGRMVEWLDIHKEFMEKTTGMIETASVALQSSAESLQKVEQATAPLASNIDGLGEVVKTVDEQMQILKATLAGVSDLGEQAKAVFPALKSGINEMTEHMDSALRQATQEMADSTKQTQEKIQNNVVAFDEQSREAIQRIVSDLGNRLTAISETLTNDYERLAAGIQRINTLATQLESKKP